MRLAMASAAALVLAAASALAGDLILNPASDTVYPDPITGPVSLIKDGPFSATMTARLGYTGSTAVNAGSLVFTRPNVIGPVSVAFSAKLDLAACQAFQSLTITDSLVNLRAGSWPTPYGDKVLVTNDLFITGTGKLDLYNNDLIIHATPQTRFDVLDRVEAMIARACKPFGGTPWSGPGLTSSSVRYEHQYRFTSLGAILNDRGDGTALYSEFDGQPVDVNTILVKYTYSGDANLDGVVDDSEDPYLRPKGSGWFYGDYDYKWMTDGDDYVPWLHGRLGQTGYSGTPYIAFWDRHFAQPPCADNQPDPCGPAFSARFDYRSTTDRTIVERATNRNPRGAEIQRRRPHPPRAAAQFPPDSPPLKQIMLGTDLVPPLFRVPPLHIPVTLPINPSTNTSYIIFPDWANVDILQSAPDFPAFFAHQCKV